LPESFKRSILWNSTSGDLNALVWNKSFANLLRIVYTYVSLALALFSGLVVVWAMGNE
jgi:hypothetical protein